MKMLPVRFRESFRNGCNVEEIYQGFEPFKDELGYHDRRIVEIEPTTWNHGVALIVRVFDKVFPVDAKPYEHEIVHFWIYDHSNNEDYVQPTSQQVMIMTALASQELRGTYACDMVHSLFVDLVLFNPKSLVVEKNLLPQVIDYYKEMRENFVDKTKIMTEFRMEAE